MRVRAAATLAVALLDVGAGIVFGLELTGDDLSRIEAAVPAGSAAGDRYAEAQMAMLHSER